MTIELFSIDAEMNKTESYKIVIIGSTGVGKTSIVQRLIDQQFTSECQSTVGVEFKLHEINLGAETIKLNIWDTAGQEKFRSVSKSYFRNSVGCLLVYAIDDHDSFAQIDGWLNDFQSLSVPNSAVLLVGNKSDLANSQNHSSLGNSEENDQFEHSRQVTEEEAIKFADRYNIDFIETSAFNGDKIEEAFIRLAKDISEKVKRGEITDVFISMNAQPPVKIDEKKVDEKKKCC